MTEKHSNRSEALRYIGNLYAPEDSALTAIRTHFEQAGMAIQIGPEEGRLLQLLIKMNAVKTIVEIGTLGGYSTLWMARALPEDGRIITLDRNPDHAAFAKQSLAHDKRVTVLQGMADELLPTLEQNAPYDMLFIDADKISYPSYLDWAEKNIKENGLIVADNTLLFNQVYKKLPEGDVAPTTHANMREFNQRLANTSKYDAVMLPTGEGLSIAIKKST